LANPGAAGIIALVGMHLDINDWHGLPPLLSAITVRPGPRIVQEYDAACLVPRGTIAALDRFGNIRLG
jgi:hypothetical protein